ncbi:predicted protein [Lichtheimia corymbifera JMRC:FSU:9682]|uniref:Uncharacterized protein n=1 Tax=Lichtheimia corymbifera JMRC:FSU:9682 TaxID=1263082 RepID=A0A068SG30_9FUNG|nr:predicted protein [Lichtheimia corymbifera JMRC:FSU:9682]
MFTPFGNYHHPLEPPLPPVPPHCAQQDDDTSNATTHDTIALHPLPHVSMYQGQGDTILTTTSNAITTLATQLIEQLDTRAKSLANGAQFDLSLRDAALIRALAPTSALGYLRTGYVYQQQGPSTDDGYRLLETSCAAAMEAEANVIDFMSELPADIVSMTIVPFLFENYKLRHNSVCPYFYVCRTWRERILANNVFHFHLFRKYGLDCPDYDLLPCSPHFKRLTMVQRQDWAQILNEKPWPRLTHLDVDCKYGATTPPHERAGIHRLEIDAFEDFNIYNHTWNISYCITRHLEECPNLVSLHASRMTHQSPWLLSRQYHKLIQLHINYWSTEPLAYDNMVNILTHLPSLVSLDVGPRPDIKVLPMIHQYTPNLKLLAYGGDDSYDMVYGDQQQGWSIG